MALINTLTLLKTHWAAGGTHTIAVNTDGGSGGVYTLDADITCSTNPLTLTATETVVIDAADTYDIIIDSVNFTVSGLSSASKLQFKKGVADSFQVKATSAGLTGTCNFCAFDEANAGEGFGILGALADVVDVTCNTCTVNANSEDGFDIAIDAIGADSFLRCNNCTATNHKVSVSTDGYTAHRAGQSLILTDCTADACTNGVSVIGDATPTNDGPIVDIDGFIVTNCDIGIKVRTDNIWDVTLANINISAMTNTHAAQPAGIDFADGTGAIDIDNAVVSCNALTKYGISIDTTVAETITSDINNCIVYGATDGAASGYRTTEAVVDMRNCVSYNNNIAIQVEATDVTGATTDAHNCIFMNSLSAVFGAWFSNVFEDTRDTYLRSSSNNNFFYNNAADFHPDATDELKVSDLSTDPGMVDPANDNFTITTSSNAFEAGNIANSSVTDILGVTRSDPPDVGAYEAVAQSNGYRTGYENGRRIMSRARYR